MIDRVRAMPDTSAVLSASAAPRFRLPRPAFADADAVLFSLKTFGAGMLAFGIALAIGLEHPVWALTTAYIVSQPYAGGVVGKALYRLLGTAISGVVAILLVPNLVNAPELLSLALALWLGLCSFLAALNRSPSAYTFLMSGYTVSIIAYPTLEAPQTVFTIAAFRVQEIAIGILCGALIHGAVFPRTVTARLLARARAIVNDAERWSAEALDCERPEAATGERRRIATDLEELRQLSASLPFDTARLMPRPATVQALRDQLMQLLPLATAVEDRLRALAATGPLPAPVAALIADARAWLTDPSDREGDRAPPLIARAAALEPAAAAPLAWRDLLLLGTLGRLGDLLAIHARCRLLAAQVEEPDRVFRRAAVPLVRLSRWRALHLDVGSAARTALAAVLISLAACTFWIATAWDQGANAVLFAGVVVALFGSQDNPKRGIFTFLAGMTIGSLTGLFYAFLVLPRATDLPVLLALLFPAFFIGGVGMGTPSAQQRSTGFILGIINSSGLDLRYDSSFEGVVNATLALVLGVMFASFTIGLVAGAGGEGSVRRLVEAGWRDLARRANAPGHARPGDWVSRMLDRIGLLVPRLEALGGDPGGPLLSALVDMRTGVNAATLRDLRIDRPEAEPVVTPVLRGVAGHYAALRADAPQPPPEALRDEIDRAMAGLLAQVPDADARRTGLLALTGLRRNLFPAAPPVDPGLAA